MLEKLKELFSIKNQKDYMEFDNFDSCRSGYFVII